MIGQTLSHYRITDRLGAGGMGEVYRATDTTLNREVAIKVLPPEVARDEERLARFRREAQLLAALNHPNVAAIYGLEEAGGQPFLALELVEGEDLKERLARGPLPVDEALEIAKQIAEALEEAHAKGIVHRDLKPANVKVTPEGQVKVLDFGLAKAWGGEAGSGTSSLDLSASPTLARTGTLAGVILGTAGYMSPEQASGKAVDKRADIWSFGVVLLEMLTGQPVYTGETASEILASVIKEEPAWDRVPEGCPPAIARLLRRCLRKRPRERLQDIGDARVELTDALSGVTLELPRPVDAGETAGESRRLRRQRGVWTAAALALGAVAAVLAGLHLARTPEARPVVRFGLALPEGLTLEDIDPLAVSPDGRHVVFAAHQAGEGPRLWLRPLDATVARALPGTEGAQQPFWSPDSTSVAFFAEETLRKLNLTGGTVERVCALPAPRTASGSWSDQGTLLFSAGSQTNGSDFGLYTVGAAGGDARPLTTPDEPGGHFFPQWLPGGRQFLFVLGTGSGEESGLELRSLEQPRERRRVRPGTARTLFVPPGHLLFVQGDTLLAQPFDPDGAEMKDESLAVASPVAKWPVNPALNWAWFSASADGVLAYQEGVGSADLELAWFDRAGRRLGVAGPPDRYRQIILSPDERSVAAEIAGDGGNFDLWVVDVTRGVASRVTSDPAADTNPVWSRDGRELFFSSNRGEGPSRVYRLSLQGNQTPSLLVDSSVDIYSESLSPDGETLLYVGPLDTFTLSAVPKTGPSDVEPEVLLKAGAQVDEPQISPDGRWLAYGSMESGGWEVYVEPFRRPGEKVRVSPNGGVQPKWRADSRELFYLTPAGELVAVEAKVSGERLEVGLPTPLFSTGTASPVFDQYAVAGDGQRFLVLTPVVPAARTIQVLLNWTSLLE